MSQQQRQSIALVYQCSSYWCGDLGPMKECLDAYMAGDVPLHCVDVCFVRHARRVKADLLLLALVRASIVSEFGSVSEHRDKERGKVTVPASGWLVLQLVMPWVLPKC